MMEWMRQCIGGVWLMAAAAPAAAAVYSLPPVGSDLVGEVRTVTARAEDTLLDIARRQDLGYNEIVAANPGLDPWLPGEGARVLIPSRYILPSAPREGIVINLAEMRLYYYPPPQRDGKGVVMTFPIGIGQAGWATPLGETRIVGKKRNPAWTVPASIRAASAAAGEPLPPVVPPGPDNPLGSYALRLGMPGYLIHGTNKPFGVGRRVSHGCIRLYPEDIEVLFAEVSQGTPVRIVDQPYKLGRADGRLYLEAHAPVVEPGKPWESSLPTVVQAAVAVLPASRRERVQMEIMRVASRHSGVPEPVATLPQTLPALEEGGWMLQVGAFSDPGKALALAESMAWLERPVTVKARVDDGYCHVLVGPYDRQGAALAAQARLAARTGMEGQIVPADRHGLVGDCAAP